MKKEVINKVSANLVRNHAGDIDLVKEFSYGKKAKSMIESTATGIKLGYKIKNDTKKDHVVYVAAMTVLGLSPEIDGKTSLPQGVPGSEVVFSENPQLRVTEDTGVDAEEFKITPLNSKREIAQLRGFAATSPVQVTELHMVSRNIANNNPDTTNYNNPIKTYWFTPFYDVEEDEFQLRTLLDSSMNSPQFAEAKFAKNGFNALISNQHVIAIQVNAGTELTVTMGVGAYDARPERFYRKTKAANRVLSSIR